MDICVFLEISNSKDNGVNLGDMKGNEERTYLITDGFEISMNK